MEKPKPNIHEIRVGQNGRDPEAEAVLHEAHRVFGSLPLDEIETTRIYRLEGVSDEEAAILSEAVLVDPISQSSPKESAQTSDKIKVEVAYKPGVMNPEAESIIKAANDLGIRPIAADSSTEYRFSGDLSNEQVDQIVGGLLVNDTVQHVVAHPPETLVHDGVPGPVEEVPVRSASDKELEELSKDKLFLSTDEMRAIQGHFRKLDREPTDCELEIIAASWSEHCGHKTFNATIELADGQTKDPLFKRIKDTAREHFGDRVLSAFHDNSGVIRFYDGQAICGKVETHNSPSAIEPYGGAMTGSGGVFRDIVGTGQGAKNIISTDMFCLAPPDLEDSALPPGTLRPDYLQRRVVQGVRDYGNRMGIPTANGSLHFHEDFRAKPTVIVGAYGIQPEEYSQKGEPQVGDLVVSLGGRTGRDGIHGATFSSGEMTDRTASVNSSAVQIGNAIEEKRTFDAIIEARDSDCIRAITDCGAAGFSSAIGEMGEDIGVTVDISRAPLKYEGLAPWEVFLSESQERMVIAVPPEQIDQFTKICEKFNVESAVLGEFDGSHTLTVNYGEQNVAELEYDFLKNGLPNRVMKANWTQEAIEEIVPKSPETPEEWRKVLLGVMSHGNVCSKQPIVNQYDHGVQGGNIVNPFGGKTEEGPNDALVVRPMLGKPYGVVQSHGMNPILNRLDPYQGSQWAIAEAMANYVAVGGDPDKAALINNFIWPFPDEQEMGSLDKSVDAITDMMDELELPVISGKDSLSSTYRGKDGEVIKIPPVLCMSAFGPIPDVDKTMTADIKMPGKTKLVLVGHQSQNMGGSTYYDVAGGQSGKVPEISGKDLRKTLQTVHKAMRSGRVQSCHDVSEGGIAGAVSEMCFGGDSGARVWVPEKHKDNPENFLFNETAGQFVIEVDMINHENISQLFEGVPTTVIGVTSVRKRLEFEANVGFNYKNLFDITISEAKDAWQRPTKELF
jgi:phosphoribosylformylglycinamidine synthase